MFRGFEAYGGTDGEADFNSQSFGGVVGYDRAVGKDARLGSFLAYGKTSYSADHLNAYTSLGGKWTGQAEIRGERSANDHKEVYSLSAQYHF